MKAQFFLLPVLLSCTGCYIDSDYEPQKRQLNGILNVTIKERVITADSASTSVIYFSLPVDVDSAKLQLKVKSNSGTFIESGSNSATIMLKFLIDSVRNVGKLTLKSSSIPSVADLQIEFETTITNEKIEFVRAFPEAIKVSASSLSIKPVNNIDGEANITVKVSRPVGVPSQDTEIFLNVYDSSYSKKLGLFKLQAKYSDKYGLVQSVFVLGDSLVNKVIYQGAVQIVGSTKDAKGNVLSDTVHIFSSK